MSGISIGHPRPRPCFGSKTLRRCRNNGEADNVILIDDDSENFDNVIIIDVPESLPKKSRGREKDKKKNVIYIDDDDNETPNSYHSIGENNVNCTAGPSSSRKSCPGAKHSADVDEEFEFVQVNVTPVRLSKCKRTYSGKASVRNRYGLDTDSENDLSDNDCPDCELVEDSSGVVQQQWEKAFSRRRKHINNSTSQVHKVDCHQNVESTDETRNKEDASCSNAAKLNSEDDVPSPSPSPFRAGQRWAFNFDDHPVDDFSLHSFLKRHMNINKNDACSRSDPQTKEFDNPTPGFWDEENPILQPCPKEADSHLDKNSFSGKSSPATMNEVCQDSFQRDTQKNIHEMATDSVKENVHLKTGLPHPACHAKEMKNLMPERSSFNSSTLPDKLVNHNSPPSRNAASPVSNESLFSEKSVVSGDDTDKAYHQENGHLNEAKLREDDLVANSQQKEDKDDEQHSQNGDTLPVLESCLINEREKLKKTDEYKRAVEEEWASRQQALLLQAEEAQHLRRLRKRKKAESMRLLDMERRQKQRVEEIRNTQKKDEENMNLKEVIRAEVRKELKKVEITCRNMASLLHLLGIRVGGWPNPLPQEVQAAYKRALLTFHPDRASRSDIRQQVEAEEKFKLINRLKEKFPPSL